MKRIFLIEDDKLFSLSLASYLQAQGFEVDTDSTGAGAVERIQATQPDAVVLDCILPGKDGFDICREVRSTYRNPIIMLTARSEDVDQMLGLGLGADAYLVKPVTPHLLLAHLRALFRRSGKPAQNEADELRYGRFFISRKTRTARLGEKALELSTSEFDLLWLLASQAGVVLSRDDISLVLRQIRHDGVDRTIDTRIARLRKRLGDSADQPLRIKTVRGKGYLFNALDWD
jgi:two-component system OmpR family response regulator/two-component system response regulator RstA